MKDWKAIASANGIELTEEEWANLTPPLSALEAAFRPLVASIPHEIEPAIVLSEPAVEGR